MSSDGENAKNPTAEVDEKPNLDTTDSSQDSSQDAVKSENEDNREKKADGDAKPQEKSDSDKPDEKPEINENNEKKEDVNNDTNDDSKKVKDEKKKEEKDEKTDDDTEEDGGGDASEDAEEDDDKKDLPLLDQPLEQSGPRERKKVQRFSEKTPEPKEKEVTKVNIPSGSGSQLGDIPRIDASISRFKTEDLKLLHRVLFKEPGKTIQIKKNIRKFSGFDFKKDSDAYSQKLKTVQKMEMKQLKSICEMLDLDKKGNRDEIGERICEFLLEPKDSGKAVGGGRPKRTAAVRANNRAMALNFVGYSSGEEDDDSDAGRKSRAKRGKGRRANLKDETSSDDDAEFNPSDSEDEEERPRVTKRRGPSRGKKKQEESEEEDASEVEETPSSDDSEEPKSKRKRGSVGKPVNNRSKKASPKNAKTPAKKNSVTPNKKKAEPAKRGRKRTKQESEEEDKESEENNAASSSEDEPLVKKPAPQPPSDEEIKTYVKEILEGANLEEITMKTVCKQVYAHYPDFDLAHKKDFIKTTVKSLIST